MSHPFDRMRFSRIETRGTLPDGRVITASYSYPEGASHDEYARIDAALRKAFGNNSSRTVGTPMWYDRVGIERAFRYLEGLRDRAAVNMWGASPYLARYLGVPDTPTGVASTLLTTWISSFDGAPAQDFDARVAWAVEKLGTV